MKNAHIFTSVLLFVGILINARAQLIVDPAQQAGIDKIEGGLVLSLSDMKYDAGSTYGKVDINRTTFGGYGAYGLDEQVDVFATLGMIIDAEADGVDGSGSGFSIGGGGRIDLLDVGQLDVLVYGQMSIIVESYGMVDSTIGEISAGAIAKYAIDQQFNIYGGMDIYPFSIGSADEYDFERNSVLGMRIGANMDLGEFWIRGEIAFLGEQTITIGTGTYF